MNTHRYLLVAAIASTGLAVLVSSAQAQGVDEKLTVRFSIPVAVPGEVLPAGTYIFERLERGNITRILSADEMHVYATLFTVSDERTEPIGNENVVLREGPKGTPERVDEWFYPGDSSGNEFIYPNASGRRLSTVIEAGPREAGRAVKATAMGVAGSAKFVAVHTDHLVAKTVGRGIKAL